MGSKQRLLRRHEVEQRVGLGKSSIYQRSKDGSFPRPIKIGTSTVAWLETEIDEWLQAQIDKSRGVA